MYVENLDLLPNMPEKISDIIEFSILNHTHQVMLHGLRVVKNKNKRQKNNFNIEAVLENE